MSAPLPPDANPNQQGQHRTSQAAEPILAPEAAMDALAQAFSETQARLKTWEEQYQQIQTIQATLNQNQQKGIGSETQRLRKQLREIELDLALTIVLSLGDAAREYWQEILQQESFWNFLRFAGLGFVLGVVVKALIS